MSQSKLKVIMRYSGSVLIGACMVTGIVGFGIETIRDRSHWLLDVGLFCIGMVVGAGFMGSLVLFLPCKTKADSPKQRSPFIGGPFTK